MGRRRIIVKQITDERLRHVTFSKRKKGLINKAAELSLLCNVKMLLIFEDGNGNLIQFSRDKITSIPSFFRSCKYSSVSEFTAEDYPNFFTTTRHQHRRYEDKIDSLEGNSASKPEELTPTFEDPFMAAPQTEFMGGEQEFLSIMPLTTSIEPLRNESVCSSVEDDSSWGGSEIIQPSYHRYQTDSAHYNYPGNQKPNTFLRNEETFEFQYPHRNFYMEQDESYIRNFNTGFEINNKRTGTANMMNYLKDNERRTYNTGQRSQNFYPCEVDRVEYRRLDKLGKNRNDYERGPYFQEPNYQEIDHFHRGNYRPENSMPTSLPAAYFGSKKFNFDESLNFFDGSFNEFTEPQKKLKQ